MNAIRWDGGVNVLATCRANDKSRQVVMATMMEVTRLDERFIT